MPIYEYSCNTCGHKFDTLQKMDAPPPPCPACGAEVRKLVSAAAFVLKGGGWYKDHYGLKGGSSEGASSGGASSGGTKSEPSSPAASPAAAAPASTPASTPSSTPSTGS